MKSYKTLPDGRTICERDARTVVLDDLEAAGICEKVKTDLDRLFIRFITLPDTNVTLELMDRVTLQDLFKVIGQDFSCPNTLGCTKTETNASGFSFQISLLSGLPREQLMTTYIHELGHTWLNENTRPVRKKAIGKDAVEGFCELLAFLFAQAQDLEFGKSEILANHYTRGQIHLFIAAEQQFGFNEIVEWMKFGEDATLLTNELVRIRRLDLPPTTNIVTLSRTYYAPAPLAPLATLKLNGITWSKTRPMASINHRNFAVNDEAMVTYGDTNVLLRCLAIRTNAVILRNLGTGEEIELQLGRTSPSTNRPAISSSGN